MIEHQYCVYIMTNQDHTVLYTGITNDRQRRAVEQKTGKDGSFSKIYKLHKLVYFESGNDITIAIGREKQIKTGSTKKKVDLINSNNPDGEDLFKKYFG